MRRDFLIRSQRRPDVILAALEARSRQWRESEVPGRLREHGIYGIRIRIKGARVRMQVERMTTDRFELSCTADISPEPEGALIQARIRQSNPYLWMGGMIAAVMLVQIAMEPSVGEFLAAVAILTVWACLGGLIILVARDELRHDVEAKEFERILVAAATADGAVARAASNTSHDSAI